jgi:preprotein translocase subunit SecG
VRRKHGPSGANQRFRENSMSSLFTFLLVVQALVAAAMIGVILMQKSEGGGLGVDFMTRATTVLATLFVGLSIVLAAMASVGSAGTTALDTSLSKTAQQPSGGAAPLTGPAQQPAQGAPAAPVSDDPLAAAAAAANQNAPAEQAPAK